MLFQDCSFCQNSLGSGWTPEIRDKKRRRRLLFHQDQKLSFSSSGLLGEEDSVVAVTKRQRLRLEEMRRVRS